MKPLAAPIELAALAAAMRPDWNAELLDGAMVATTRTWSWDRTLSEIVRLARVEDSTVDDLLELLRDPRRRQSEGGAVPSDQGPARDPHAAADLARHLLAARRAEAEAAAGTPAAQTR
jgi:hypothetical protein